MSVTILLNKIKLNQTYLLMFIAFILRMRDTFLRRWCHLARSRFLLSFIRSIFNIFYKHLSKRSVLPLSNKIKCGTIPTKTDNGDHHHHNPSSIKHQPPSSSITIKDKALHDNVSRKSLIRVMVSWCHHVPHISFLGRKY